MHVPLLIATALIALTITWFTFLAVRRGRGSGRACYAGFAVGLVTMVAHEVRLGLSIVVASALLLVGKRLLDLFAHFAP